jgi:hypothetical protein
MPNPNVEKAAEICSGFVFEQYGERIAVPEAKAFIQDTLFGPKDLWAGASLGVITSTELAAAVTDRFHVWFLERTGRDIGDHGKGSIDWVGVVSRVEVALYS